jgi:putative NADH-flavin reductase
MRITVFGGSGPTGLELIQRARNHGHTLTAYVRDPAKLPVDGGLRVVTGQLDDRGRISEAISGADAVVSALGPIKNSPSNGELVPGYRAIVAAMHDCGVQRIVALGTPAIKDPSDGADRRVGALTRVGRVVLPNAYTTTVDIGRVLRESGLKWTIVRVLVLRNASLLAGLKCSNPASDPNIRMVGERGGLITSRPTAAAALLQMAEAGIYIEAAPFVTDK